MRDRRHKTEHGRSRHGVQVFALLVAFLAASCGIHFLPRRISGYHGDGTISRIKFFPNQGFRIDFEDFLFSETYHGSFRLTSIPRHPSGYYVGIAFVEEPNPFRVHNLERWSNGTIRFALRNDRDATLMECAGSLRDMGWSYVGEGMFVYKRLLDDGSIDKCYLSDELIKHRTNRPASLEAWYTPGAGAPALPVRIRLSAGGYK